MYSFTIIGLFLSPLPRLEIFLLHITGFYSMTEGVIITVIAVTPHATDAVVFLHLAIGIGAFEINVVSFTLHGNWGIPQIIRADNLPVGNRNRLRVDGGAIGT